MTDISRRSILVSTLAFTACSQALPNPSALSEVFICPPCGCSEDETEFEAPGLCPDCGMTLMPKHENKLGFEPTVLRPRAGSFELAGGVSKAESRITVHYYLPDGFTPESKVLLVIPGAGRNSFDYRNAWLGAAREHNILVAALGYQESDYDLAAYNMGGVLKNFRAQNIDNSTPGVIRARDEDIAFDINSNKAEWLFNDFDRVFAFLKTATGAKAANYDIFGHSAGGQILHRLALFQPTSRANKIIAANAGWYTLPDMTTSPPTGLQGLPVNGGDLIRSFASDLTILLGENDNDDAAGGTLLHTPIIDQQGLGRLQRGQTFYQVGQDQAKSLGAPYNWLLRTISDVGHDFRAMSQAAAEIIVA